MLQKQKISAALFYAHFLADVVKPLISIMAPLIKKSSEKIQLNAAIPINGANIKNIPEIMAISPAKKHLHGQCELLISSIF